MHRIDRSRIAILFVLVAGITALHYLTTIQYAQFHDIYRRLYYLPIVLGGLWFGLRGGIGVALAVSLLYLPHVVLQWGHHPLTEVEQYLEILLYNVIGGLTGLLSQRERLQKERYQQAARILEENYAKLRQQADQILEIEEQLRRADRLSALGELSAGMAHEIRNPLGSIRGTAEILRDGMAVDDPRSEFAAILIREVDRLNRVVQDFLEFARPGETGRSPVDLNQLLQELLLLTRQPTRSGGVAVDFAPGSIPLVQADSEQLRQAFLNLILNALQAMPDGGTLQIASRSDGETVSIEFRDSGGGIPPANLSRIFNPFFTTRSEGTGLGLAITHRIVQGHGGRIEVASQPGVGTLFTLTFPALATG
ncbi:two-component system sensor histidine kinase NtrB [Desulfuromonas carbonis]